MIQITILIKILGRGAMSNYAYKFSEFEDPNNYSDNIETRSNYVCKFSESKDPNNYSENIETRSKYVCQLPESDPNHHEHCEQFRSVSLLLSL